MRVAGIVCEYNPFHNGHQHLIEKARNELSADYIICALSSSFLQRGEPSIISKHARAEMAINCGADIVFEIPQIFSSRDAETYAAAGASILEKSGVVTDMVFGSELDDIPLLISASQILEFPDKSFTDALERSLLKGSSLALAKGDALISVLGEKAAELKKPNVSLALSYMRSLIRSSSKIVPHAVKRIGEEYGSEKNGTLASAAGIRKAIQEKDYASAYASMPKAAAEILKREISTGRIVSETAYRAALASALCRQTCDEAGALIDVSEGLENYIYKKLKTAAWVSPKELAAKIKTRRYTTGRLNRFFSSTLLGLTKEACQRITYVPYLRLLAMRKSAAALMKTIQKSSSLSVITKPALYTPNNYSEEMSRIIDARAQDIWSAIIEKPIPMGEDYRQSPVII